jgi:6-phosphogluconolactonase
MSETARSDVTTGGLARLPLSRRDFISLSALGIAGCALPRIGNSPAEGDRMLYIGTYTDDHRSKGIYLLRLAPDTGALSIAGLAAESVNPSFVALSPDGEAAFAVNEIGDVDGKPGGMVTAFTRNGIAATLGALASEPTRGAAPCYVSTDRSGRLLFVANYGGGSVAMFPVLANGSIGAMSGFIQHHGHGPNAERQEGPHAHCVIADPANRFVLVADLGLDRIMVYRFDADSGTLSTSTSAQGMLAPGSGPRHLAFHPDGRVVYVTNELASTVSAFRYDPDTGSLTELQTVPAVSEPTSVPNAPADIHLHPSGRFLYMSNRGHNSIAVFAIDRDTAMLAPVQLASTEGDWPRNFAIDPSGDFLIVANQRSDSIHSFRIDAASGRVTSTGHRISLPAPVCVRYFTTPA